MIKATIYFILGAFLRRWFGGMLNDYKIVGNRGVQTAFMIATFMTIYVADWHKWECIVIGGIVSYWLQFQFWSRGHGACFDIGNGKPDTETIRRYNERWYHIPCDRLIPEQYRYGMLYDLIYMWLRYTCPMIPMMLIDWRYILVGASVSPIYAVFWYIWNKDRWIYSKCPKWCNSATNWGEIIAGGTVFAGCAMIGI